MSFSTLLVLTAVVNNVFYISPSYREIHQAFVRFDVIDSSNQTDWIQLRLGRVGDLDVYYTHIDGESVDKLLVSYQLRFKSRNGTVYTTDWSSSLKNVQYANYTPHVIVLLLVMSSLILYYIISIIVDLNKKYYFDKVLCRK